MLTKAGILYYTRTEYTSIIPALLFIIFTYTYYLFTFLFFERLSKLCRNFFYEKSNYIK